MVFLLHKVIFSLHKVTHFQLLCPIERDSANFFFRLYRANFDDLRPLKPEFDTFEALWGSKMRFCVSKKISPIYNAVVQIISLSNR